MRVYLARGCTMPEELLRLFRDTGLRPETAGAEDGERALWKRLSLLEKCDAICLPPDWRGDPESRIEKAYADYCRIPQLSYYLPGGKGGRGYRRREQKNDPRSAQAGEDQTGAGAAEADGDR